MEVSIARALNEVKMLTKRIDRASKTQSFFQYKIGEGKAQPAVTENYAETYQSLVDMIDRRAKIKNAITLANASTMVEINGETYSIAEAIALKDGLASRALILQTVTRDYQRIVSTVGEINEDAENRLARLLEANFGKDKRASSGDYDIIAEPFKKANQASILNEEETLKLIQKHQEELETFTNDVDFALSEVNAITKIEIP